MSELYCNQADCDKRTGCIFGEPNPDDCEYRKSGEDTPTADALADTPMPWHGSAFGLTELQFVAARGRPRLIGIVGEHNAGKTTFLTSVYLMLFHGTRMPGKTFAGSFTLRAWEELANNLRYPNDTEPMFPRHTPDTVDRVPGLLHLAFRNQLKRIEDYLFTDAPGEWFTYWAKNRNADNAKGARWIANNADMFLFFIDSEELAGVNCGTTRNSLTNLAQRLSDERNGRDVVVLWSKADQDVDAGIREQVTSRLDRYLPGAKHVCVSVKDPERKGIHTVAETVLGQSDRRGRSLVLSSRTTATDPFLRFRAG